MNYKKTALMFLCFALFLTAATRATAAEPFCERYITYRGGEDGYNTYRLPTMVVTERGTVLIFCDGRMKSSRDLGNKIHPVVRRSVDGGKTWEPMQVLHDAPADRVKIGNGCPMLDRETGAVHFLYCYDLTRAYIRTTTDEGVTFAEPVEVTEAFKQFDFPWKYFATGHVHGIQVRDGRLIAPVWLCDRPRGGEKDYTYTASILYSTDHGKTFQAGGLVPYNKFRYLNESSVFECSDGSLCYNCRGRGEGYRVISRSRDLGLTWSEPRLDKNLPGPTCQAPTLVLPSRDEKHRVIFANPATQKGRKRMTVRLSYDDGRTWPVSKLVDPLGAGYSDLAVDGQGNIYLAYEACRKRYSEYIAVVRFNLEWLTAGKDSLGAQ